MPCGACLGMEWGIVTQKIRRWNVVWLSAWRGVWRSIHIVFPARWWTQSQASQTIHRLLRAGLRVWVQSLSSMRPAFPFARVSTDVLFSLVCVTPRVRSVNSISGAYGMLTWLRTLYDVEPLKTKTRSGCLHMAPTAKTKPPKRSDAT